VPAIAPAKHDIRFAWLLAVVATLAAFLVFAPLGIALALGLTAYALHAAWTAKHKWNTGLNQ
jgi:hypothetical protein